MSRADRKPALWRRILRWLFVFIVVVTSAAVARFMWVTRDRNPGYSVAISIATAQAEAEPKPLRVGFATKNINPDINNPAEPVWLAGFDQGRSATNIHDDLEAVAVVVDDGHHRIGIVAIDSIGFFHDDAATVRKRLAAMNDSAVPLDYVTVCSTHNHSTPDLMGLWGPDPFHSGINENYRRHVIESAAAALAEAYRDRQPARMASYEIPTLPAGLVTDTRKPEVYDADIRVLHFLSATNDSTLGTLVGWANHPETPWSQNRDITADFPGVIRQALAKGIIYEGTTRTPGLGGTHVYVNGAVGGLMSTTPSVTVRDRFLGADFKEPSHDKTRALGNNLAAKILDRIRTNAAPAVSSAAIGVEASTMELPLANPGFAAASFLGLLDRGHSGFMKIRTEVAILRLGDVSMACVPGEIYPEIVNGGIVRAPGGDFDIEPLEVPPLREMMPGRVKFVFGLANDEIGYIIPKSEWDTKPPHLFGANKAPYGEINSLGPDTAWLLHSALRERCKNSR
jgi:hypothetical protein